MRKENETRDLNDSLYRFKITILLNDLNIFCYNGMYL